MNKQIIKKSEELNELIDSLYDISSETQKNNFKIFLKKNSFKFYENDYPGTHTYLNDGVNFYLSSNKKKVPIYLVYCSRWSVWMVFIDTIQNIKNLLNKEKDKLLKKDDLSNTLKLINAEDAAILAYVAVSTTKDKKILSFLSKEYLPLGRCLLGEKGKYSKDVLNAAKIYKNWADYKKSSKPNRYNNKLDLSKI